MKVSLEGLKAFMGKPAKVETPLFDTITDEVKPLMVENDTDNDVIIERVPFVSFGVVQHTSVVALDDKGILWILREGEENWNQLPYPTRKASKLMRKIKHLRI